MEVTAQQGAQHLQAHGEVRLALAGRAEASRQPRLEAGRLQLLAQLQAESHPVSRLPGEASLPARPLLRLVLMPLLQLLPGAEN